MTEAQQSDGGNADEKLPNTQKVERLLAFDFGTHKIGVAYAQTLLLTATPLGLVKAKQGIPNWQQLEVFVEKWNPQLLIVGLPLHMSGSNNSSAKQARKFSRRMAEYFELPVSLVDERLSSQEASYRIQELKYQHPNSLASKLPLDAWSATLIAESWLYEYSNNK